MTKQTPRPELTKEHYTWKEALPLLGISWNTAERRVEDKKLFVSQPAGPRTKRFITADEIRRYWQQGQPEQTTQEGVTK